MRCANCGFCAPVWSPSKGGVICAGCGEKDWYNDSPYPPPPDLVFNEFAAPPRPLIPLWVVLLLAVLIFGLLGTAFAYAQEPPNCEPIADIQSRHPHDKWTKVSDQEWEFLRGVYAMNPLTPPGLPYGDQAMLISREGTDGAMVMFIDGDRACTPMPAPKNLLDLLKDVAAGKITHEGDPL